MERCMTQYTRILLVVDLTETSQAIARRAAELSRQNGAALRVLHVVEFIPVEPMTETLMPPAGVETQLIERARQKLADLAATCGIPADACRVETGNVKAEILRAARELPADLIVLGARERHGVSILVNFTEDTVLHAAPCDVLAVRVK